MADCVNTDYHQLEAGVMVEYQFLPTRRFFFYRLFGIFQPWCWMTQLSRQENYIIKCRFSRLAPPHGKEKCQTYLNLWASSLTAAVWCFIGKRTQFAGKHKALFFYLFSSFFDVIKVLENPFSWSASYCGKWSPAWTHNFLVKFWGFLCKWSNNPLNNSSPKNCWFQILLMWSFVAFAWLTTDCSHCLWVLDSI